MTIPRLSLCFMIFPLTGFLVHTFLISQTHFAFETLTIVTQPQKDEYEVPSFTLCCNYLDVMNVSGNTDQDELFGKYTIRQIMELTPATETAIDSCFYRETSAPDIVKWLPGSECNKVISTSKFYMQQFVCYTFALIHNREVSIRRTATSLYWSKIYLAINLNLVFDQVHYMLPIVHFGGLPITSRNYAPSILRRSIAVPLNQTKDICRDYMATFGWTSFKLKEWPYDTNCNKKISMNHCLSSCMIDRVNKSMNKVPYSEIITQSLDQFPLTRMDLRDPVIGNNVSLFAAECRGRCRQRSCEYSIVSTRITCSKNNSPRLRFKIGTPDSILKQVTSTVRLDFATFMSQLLSCLGIWFGVSIFSLNPFHRKSDLRRFIRKARSTAKQANVLKTGSLFDGIKRIVYD